MRQTQLITSPANPRLKAVIALRRRRTRDETGHTLVEGFEELSTALAAGARPQTIYYCPELSAATTTPEELAGDTEIVQLSRAAFEKVAYREGPDGWLAVVPTITTELAALRLPARPLLLVCESVEKPGNLGAILRTADAAGVSAVIAASPITDWGNPNVVRASKGTLFAVPVASADTPEVLDWLGERGVSIVVTTPHTDLSYTDVDLSGPTALVVGAEKDGVSAAWLAAARHRVLIPMFGRANSLNVATSAAIVTYEAIRQRAVKREE